MNQRPAKRFEQTVSTKGMVERGEARPFGIPICIRCRRPCVLPSGRLLFDVTNDLRIVCVGRKCR